MVDLLKEIGDFVMQRIGVEGTGILLMTGALIYIWFQHHRLKLLEERLSFTEEKRAAAARELEQLSKSATTQKQPPPRIVDRETIGIPKTVLIADDETMMCELLAHIVKAQFKDASIVVAGEGEETLQHIDRYAPSLLILDLMMPGKTGYEVLKELSNRSERFPILVVSGYASSKEQVAARAQIASDRIEFLSKPFSLEEMAGMIQQMLSQQDVR